MPKKDFHDSGFSSSFFSNSSIGGGSGLRQESLTLYEYERPQISNQLFPSSNNNSEIRYEEDQKMRSASASFTSRNADYSTSDVKEYKKILINLTLINGMNLKSEATDVKKLPNVEVAANENNEVQLSNLSTTLLSWNMIPPRSLLFYKDAKEDMFIHAGDFTDDNVFIPLNKDKSLIMKFRKMITMTNTTTDSSSSVFSYATTNDVSNDFEEEEKANPDSDGEEEKQKRVKERNIKEIMEKVLEWRQYYQGYHDENGVWCKLKLEDAAKKVGISKKTLDDYLLQIKFGLKYKFDFDLNMTKKVGVLRTFVKTKRDADKHAQTEDNKAHQKNDTNDIENIKEILRRSYGKGKKIELGVEVKEEIQIEHPPVDDLRQSCFRPSIGLGFSKGLM